MKLFLLILDSDINDYYLHGVFDDTQESRNIIMQITSEGMGYRIVRGQVIEECAEHYEDDEIDY